MVFARGASWWFRVVRKNKKYFPEQFDIIGCSYEYGDCGKHQPGTSWGCEIGGTPIYKRLFIRRK